MLVWCSMVERADTLECSASTQDLCPVAEGSEVMTSLDQ